MPDFVVLASFGVEKSVVNKVTHHGVRRAIGVLAGSPSGNKIAHLTALENQAAREASPLPARVERRAVASSRLAGEVLQPLPAVPDRRRPAEPAS